MDGRVPEVVFKTRVRDESIGGDNPFRWQDLTTQDLFAGKRVLVFSLPGAFTPTCSNEQCPAFERSYEEVLGYGIDEVICIAVNDAFVMFQWGKHLGVSKIRLIPDGSILGAGVIVGPGVRVGKWCQLSIGGAYDQDVPDKTFYAPGYDGPVRILKF